MAGLELTDALARLLSDSELRQRFLADRAGVLAGLELAAADCAVLEAMDAGGLETQAQVLLGKRSREVARIIPTTWAGLDATAAAHFNAYAAAAPWPEGHRRHAMDALNFLRWLATQQLTHDRLELLRLTTRLGTAHRRIALVASRRPWRPPALYLAWRGRRCWHEWLLSLGQWAG